MEKLSDLQYLKLPKAGKFFYKLGRFFISIPGWLLNLLITIFQFIKKVVIGIGNYFADLVNTFRNGDYKTRLSYVFMGFGNIARGQIGRGILFFALEVGFILYMIFFGGHWLSQLGTLGIQGPEKIYDPVLDIFITVYHDNSFKIILYSILSIFFIIALLYTWNLNIKQNKIAQEIIASGKPLKSGKEDLHSVIDDQFHKTLLALPLAGILIFTVMPIIFMILVAFTNYSAAYDGYYNNLFHWVGLDNFNTMLSGGASGMGSTFGEILAWTLIWAFFATFSNYFLGMFVALIINKKGIKIKKVWRTILVLTIAIPQFISLLYVSKLFAVNGVINKWLMDFGWISEAIDFWGDVNAGWRAQILVIVINIWIGIPYLMLIATGILMNIPEDLYESSKIDGANSIQQFGRITLPYMLFVTGPYLLTSFIGNMNNFNVIYLLSGGGPTFKGTTAEASPGHTDLLITWLFKITTGTDAKYYYASVIGIMVFLVVALLSLIIYNVLPSNKNEEDFQ